MSCWRKQAKQPSAECEAAEQARTALAVLRHLSWVRTLCADEATEENSVCLRHGKTLLVQLLG